MPISTMTDLGKSGSIPESIISNNEQFQSVLESAGVTASQSLAASIEPSQPTTWTGAQKFIGATTEAIPPVTPWSGDPPTYSAKVSRTAPAGGANPQAALIVDCVTNAASTSFEWTQINTMENYAAAGENVALYCKGNRHSSGATWAGVFEARNIGGNLTTSLYGIEVDLCSDGMDTYQNQQGIAIFYGAQTNTTGAGATTKQTNGILIYPLAGARNQLANGVHVFGTVDRVFASDANGQSALAATGIYSTAAIDLSNVGNGTPYLFRGKDDIPISLSTVAESAKVQYASSLNEIQFKAGGLVRFALPMSNSTPYLFKITSGNAVSMSASAGYAQAANVAGYLTVLIDGNPYKLAFYNN